MLERIRWTMRTNGLPWNYCTTKSFLPNESGGRNHIIYEFYFCLRYMMIENVGRGVMTSVIRYICRRVCPSHKSIVNPPVASNIRNWWIFLIAHTATSLMDGPLKYLIERKEYRHNHKMNLCILCILSVFNATTRSSEKSLWSMKQLSAMRPARCSALWCIVCVF